eukprot:TRINITY_DN16484_c0_g1_i1.p1 TRINITY_DN16484_c0_g1~~TRINITY_DN16484_c0_g1_i1.p1  ORF type:complete len:486 (+),score=58.19 TRINITY_DN16484_c0_g1_i1:86-1459(+)
MPSCKTAEAGLRYELRETLAWAERMRAERDRALWCCSKLNYHLSAQQGCLGKVRARLRASQDRLQTLQANLDKMSRSYAGARKAEHESESRCRSCRKDLQRVLLRAAAAEFQLLPHSETASRAGILEAEARARQALVGELSSATLLRAEDADRAGLAEEEAAARRVFHRQSRPPPPRLMERAEQSSMAAAGEGGAQLGARQRILPSEEEEFDWWCARECVDPRQAAPRTAASRSTFFSDYDLWCARECIPQEMEAQDNPTHGDHTQASAASDSAALVQHGACDRRKAREALFIDHICYWVAAFAPRSWAPVCAKSARTVAKVLKTYQEGWRDVVRQMGRTQSMGAMHGPDHHCFGPESGLIHASYMEIEALKQKILRTPMPPGDGCFVNTWMLHMDFTKHLYEEIRLRHKQMYLHSRYTFRALAEVSTTLADVLEMYGRRTAEDEDADEDKGSESPD